MVPALNATLTLLFQNASFFLTFSLARNNVRCPLYGFPLPLPKSLLHGLLILSRVHLATSIIIMVPSLPKT